MKRTVMCCALLLLAAKALVFAQVINVTAPTNGQVFNLGDQIMVSWNASGFSGGSMKLILRSSTMSTGTTIKDPLPNNGSPFIYTIPPTVQPDDYYIRVKHSSGVQTDSGVFTINGGLDLMSGHFSIGNVTYALNNNMQIDAINILVNYDAKSDFMLCMQIPGKCDPEHGSVVATYKIKNWKWQGDKAVPEYLYGCKYACYKSCGNIYYPRGTLRKGKGKFVVTIHPRTNNKLVGIRHQYCSIESGWAASSHMFWNNYFPELDVSLSLCISYFDPPTNYKHKIVTDTSNKKILLEKNRMTIVGSSSCGW